MTTNDDIEPNNTPNSTNLTIVGTTVKNAVLKGSVGGNDSADTYKIRLDRPAKLSALLAPKGGDLDLKLMTRDSGALIDLKTSNRRGNQVSELVNSKYLPAGEYFLQVTKGTNSTPTTNYELSINTSNITRAHLGVTMKRVTALEQFDDRNFFLPNAHKADFYMGTYINEPDLLLIGSGGLPNSSRVFSDNDDIQPNFNVGKNVDINRRQHKIDLYVMDQDFNLPFLGSDDLGLFAPLNYDALLGRVTTRSGAVVGPEGQTLIAEGGGNKRARAEYRVDFNTFAGEGGTGGGGPLPDRPINQFSLPMVQGNQQSEQLVGRNLSGILYGDAGNDTLLGKGGHDTLVGGLGGDTLNGGIGNDITYGGAGRDVHIGGSGRDTFVLDPERGVDLIKDYNDGVDKLGLSGAMKYEILDFQQEGKNLGIYAGAQKLAVLEGIQRKQINAKDFVQVDFVTIGGIEVPYVMA